MDTLVPNLLPALRSPAGWAQGPLTVGGKDTSLSPASGGGEGEPEALTLLLAPSGLSFCQLQRQQILLSGYLNSTATSYLPQCQESGGYAPVQCDLWQQQCWCVDAEGMEVYGTRQLGRPARCKSPEPRPPDIPHGLSSLHVTKTSSGLPDERHRAWPPVQRMRAF